ncbi:MAG: DUF3696 domain-containing protein [bacterium]
MSDEEKEETLDVLRKVLDFCKGGPENHKTDTDDLSIADNNNDADKVTTGPDDHEDRIRLRQFLPDLVNNCDFSHLFLWYREVVKNDKSFLTLWAARLLEDFLQSLVYLGPLRHFPERYYPLVSNPTQYVGATGKMAPHILRGNDDLLHRVNEQLCRFGLKYRVGLHKVPDPESDIDAAFSLRMVDESTGQWANIYDVGFGVSQVLPIIVQCMLSSKKTLLVEQPELHLHPALQAELGDLFIESALGGGYNTFIIETHSEHLILRIMRRMRETFEGKTSSHLHPVRPEDVSVLYVEKDGTSSIVREMPLNERGDLVKAWPGGFFEEGLREVLG